MHHDIHCILRDASLVTSTMSTPHAGTSCLYPTQSVNEEALAVKDLEGNTVFNNNGGWIKA